MPVNAELSQENWLRYQYLRDRGHYDFMAKGEKCEAFFRGEQWRSEDLALLNEQRRPAMTINKILSTIGTILGEQIQNRVEVLYRPKNGSPSEVADALTKIWTYISQENQLPWVTSDWFCDGIIRSRGFVDVRMKFDDAMQGEIEITNLNSKNVIIDSDADEYDPDKWNDIFITKWLTGQDVAILYNEDDAEYLASRDQASFVYGFDSVERMRDRFGGVYPVTGYYPIGDLANVRRNIRVLERQYRKLDKQLHFVDLATGDMRPVPSDWERNRIAALLEKAQGRISTTKKLVKRIRWTVTADNVVLHDDWSPYKHFTPVPYFPYFRYGHTVGVVENLLGPQEILNKVSSQELHVVNTTANSGWVVEQDSLLNMSIEELETRGAQTGLVLEFKKGAQPPTKISPNQTPTGLDRITYKAEESVKSISGVSDSMQGFDREDVAAKAIAYKQQRGSVNMSKVNDNLSRSNFILARNVLDLIQEYYTEPRIVNITHSDVTRAPEEVRINQPDPVTGVIENDLTLGEYSVTISSAPFRDSIEDSQFEQARGLKELGVQIPDEVLIENSRLQGRADIIKKMQAAQNSPEAQKQAQLQAAMQQAELQKVQSEAQNKGADAQLKMAKAQVEGQDNGQLDLEKLQAEIRLERERMEMELQKMREEMALKAQEMNQKLQLQAQEHQQNMAIRQSEAAQNAQIREEEAVMNRARMLREQSQQSNPNQPTKESV